MGVIRKPLHLRSLRRGITADRDPGDQTQREHAQERPWAGWRLVAQLHDAPKGGFIPIPPGSTIHSTDVRLLGVIKSATFCLNHIWFTGQTHLSRSPGEDGR